MSKSPTILIMAGGTGGHIFPGLAVAEHLQNQGWQVHWLGTRDRMEADVVPAHGIDISFIKIKGVRGKGWKSWLKVPFKVIHSVWQSMQVLKQVKPDVVLGMGGYASAPGGVAAWLNRTPLVLHEQNAVAGMTNRYLAKIASKVLSAFPNAFNGSVNYSVVGNPVRTNIAAISSDSDRVNSQKVLVVGGSLGAQVLNEVVPQALSQIKLLDVDVWHQTGANNAEKITALYEQYGINPEKAKVTDFIDDMAAAYDWADLVICRAGALTVSEVAMAGKPAIFIPLPHAVDDHQTKNAQFLVERGAAKLLPQSKLNAMMLAQKLNMLFSSETTLPKMAKASKAAATPNATATVADVCKALVK